MGGSRCKDDAMGLDTVDMGKWEEAKMVYEWLGQLVEWGGRAGEGIQASRICQAITRLARRYVE